MRAALQTRTSIGPNPSSTRFTIWRTASGSAMSAVALKPPLSLTARARRSSSTRALTATLAPSFAIRLTMLRPMPCAAPVTRQTTPFNWPISDRAARRAQRLADKEIPVAPQKGDRVGDFRRLHPMTEPADRDAVDPNAFGRHLQREALTEGEDAAAGGSEV